jgi:hypothetical protein
VEEWAEYQAAGLSFKYPVSWKLEKENKGSSLVEFNGSLTTRKDSWIELKLYQSQKKRPVFEEAQSHVRGHLKYKGHQVTAKSQVIKFGVGKSFSGVTEDFSYILSTSKERRFERHIYFGWPGYTYKLRVACSRDDYNQVMGIFAHLLETVKVSSQTGKSSGTSARH